MNPIEAAVLRTVLYADVFHFPLNVHEIHHFLIHDHRVNIEQIEIALEKLHSILHIEHGYVMLAERSELVHRRAEREQASAQLWPLAIRYGAWLARLPYVRMVAVTGALAMRNAAHPSDDLDYMIVTAANRVWLARALAIGLVRLAKLRGVVVCPNYVLSENAFEQSKKDLFIAHEIAQMIPIYGKSLYADFRAANTWVTNHLPNARQEFYTEEEFAPGGIGGMVKRGLETLLSGKLGDALENWEYRRKLRRFAPELHTPHSAAQLDADQVKGHFNDYGYFVLSQYQQRLEAYGLADVHKISLRATGD